MAMRNAFEQLIGKALDNKRVHAFLFAVVAHKLLEIVLQILENQH